MSTKKRNFVTQRYIPQNTDLQQRKIQDQQVDALHIKFQAYNNFFTIISHNHETLISDYAKQLMLQYDLLNSFNDKKQQKIDQSIQASAIQNNMFMLKLQNQKLKCKQKLLQQKLQCQKILYRKCKQGNNAYDRERKMKIQEIKLLKQQALNLEGIIANKKILKDLEKKKYKLQLFLPEIRKIVEEYSGEELILKLNQILVKVQVQAN